MDDCLPFFYANIPQPTYDWRMIYGLKAEGDNSELVVASVTRSRSLSFIVLSGHWFWGVGCFSRGPATHSSGIESGNKRYQTSTRRISPYVVQ